MSPKASEDRMVKAINRIFLKDSRTRSSVIAIEDLHWMKQETFREAQQGRPLFNLRARSLNSRMR